MVTEVAPSDSVGTALMLQTSLGFLLTMVTIQAVPIASKRWGWRWAFCFLALGPAAGIVSIRRLHDSARYLRAAAEHPPEFSAACCISPSLPGSRSV